MLQAKDMTNNPQQKENSWNKGIDEFVRDMSAVVPRPKSEIRRRINELLNKTREAEKDRIKTMIEEYKAYYNPIEDERNIGRHYAMDALLNSLKQ